MLCFAHSFIQDITLHFLIVLQYKCYTMGAIQEILKYLTKSHVMFISQALTQVKQFEIRRECRNATPEI